ncbi:MAG: NAD(P)H-dependent glycerol-3-phosphate dehydrogenase [Lachnospiraceae bacterium]|nr:NAD(P)H-dependent glycerol-3-phosphate dehydrogenase [Lachnospiraceae bacterium]
MAIVSVIGAGSWGTALAHLLENNSHDVTVWSCVESEINMLREHHVQKEKLPGVKLSDKTVFTSDLKEAVTDKNVIVLAVPSPFVRSTAKNMAPFIKDDQIIVNVAKGIEESSLMSLSQVIKDEIKNADVCVLSGPSHAEEVGAGIPTTIVVGTSKKDTAEYLQNIFMSDVFRVYTSSDVTGIELGAALKNVVALAAGIADGLGYGDNTKAALITRGMAEIARLGIVMGGRLETFYGLSGIGDLIVTCASMHSRNRRAGILIGQGKSYEEAMKEVNQIVEGVYAAKAGIKLAKEHNVTMPIIEQVNKVLFEGASPKEAVYELMVREKKVENLDIRVLYQNNPEITW